MLLQALQVEIEIKKFQSSSNVTNANGCGNAFPRVPNPLHRCM